MRISNSKKQLAKIIHENGGWRDGAEWAAQDRIVAFFFGGKPAYDKMARIWCCNGDNVNYISSIESVNRVANWHQTILSRDEYFHLHPAPDADGWIEWKGRECPVGDSELVEIKTRDGEIQLDQAYGWNWSHERGSPVKDRQIIAYRLHKPEIAPVAKAAPAPVAEAKPTIEQLAADYRNRKDYADRKQQEADAAKADAEAKLAKLVAAGLALGLALSVAEVGFESEPELVITDWRDLLEGDVVWYGGDDGLLPGEYHVMEIEALDYAGYRTVLVDDGDGGYWIDTSVVWRFIRRPAKGGTNA